MTENKLKSFNNHISSSTSDVKEMLDNANSFLKGGNTTALWNGVEICMKLDECNWDEHGWWNIVIIERNTERLAMMTVHAIVDAITKGSNSSKA